MESQLDEWNEFPRFEWSGPNDPADRGLGLAGLKVDYGVVVGDFDTKVSDEDVRLVSNVHVLPVLAGCVVLVRGNAWELPGGTVEPGETISECLQRELLEEIGAAVTDFVLLGVFRCTSSAASAYRSHIPHPHFNILIAAANVTSISAPSGWGNNEGHSEIAIAEPARMVSRLSSQPETIAMARIVEAYFDR